MDLAGPITLSPSEQAGFAFVAVMVIVVVAAVVAATIAAVIGSSRQPSAAARFAAWTGITTLVLGTVAASIIGLSVRTQAASGPGGATTTTPTTTRPPITVESPAAFSDCDAAAWTSRVRASVSPKGSPALLRCSGEFAITDVITTTPPVAPVSYRAYWRRNVDGDWNMIVLDSQAGCGPVFPTDAAFPAALCADLPLPLHPTDVTIVAT